MDRWGYNDFCQRNNPVLGEKEVVGLLRYLVNCYIIEGFLRSICFTSVGQGGREGRGKGSKEEEMREEREKEKEGRETEKEGR